MNLFFISKSSYFYQRKAITASDKYEALRSAIVTTLNDSMMTYGYRRVNLMLRRAAIIVSEKVVRRIMKEENLIIKKVRIKIITLMQGKYHQLYRILLKGIFVQIHLIRNG